MERKLLTILVVLIFLSGCSTYQVRSMPPLSAEESPVRLNQSGVKIGANAYISDGEIKAIFNYNLMEKGVLPIFITITNDSEDELEFLRQRVELRLSSGSIEGPIPAETASNDFGRNAMAEAVLLFGVLSYDNAKEFNNDMKRDWVNKSFPEVLIVAPSRTSSRFLYFNVGNTFNLSGSVLSITYERNNQKTNAALKF